MEKYRVIDGRIFLVGGESTVDAAYTQLLHYGEGMGRMIAEGKVRIQEAPDEETTWSALFFLFVSGLM